ncbi:MAG: GPR endopeptidase [Bacilli bacterium]|nr:GPR endopeptidase [Bacilli bacterium]
MNHEINLSNYKIRTDLAIESLEQESINVDNVKKYDDVSVTYVNVDQNLSKKLNKKIGTYITIEFDDVTDYNNRKKVEKIFSKNLKSLLKKEKINENASCLVIGLGNNKSTPDSLGPKSINDILVTNHLFLYGEVEEGFRKVFAISPGVTGQTGIETSDLIKGIIDVIKPDFVIAIDALASSSITRVNKTIQITNTGIHPGSGIGNKRKEISKETIGLPVIALGVPTVVDAVTIVSDTIHYMYEHVTYTKMNMDKPSTKLAIGTPNLLEKDIQVSDSDKKNIFGAVGNLNENETKQLIEEVLTPIGYNLMVTPKEVDFVIECLSSLIAGGINLALHKKIK